MVGTKGDICLDPAYGYSTALKAFVTVDQATSEKNLRRARSIRAGTRPLLECDPRGDRTGALGRRGPMRRTDSGGDRNVSPHGAAGSPASLPAFRSAYAPTRIQEAGSGTRQHACTRRRRIGTLEPTGCGAKTQPMPKRGLLLDIDGTLLDSNGAHAAAYVDALAGEGIDVPVERVRILIGMGGEKLLARIGVDPRSGVAQRVVRSKREIFADRYLPALRPTRGARDLLDQRGARAGFCLSSRPRRRPKSCPRCLAPRASPTSSVRKARRATPTARSRMRASSGPPCRVRSSAAMNTRCWGTLRTTSKRRCAHACPFSVSGAEVGPTRISPGLRLFMTTRPIFWPATKTRFLPDPSALRARGAMPQPCAHDTPLGCAIVGRPGSACRHACCLFTPRHSPPIRKPGASPPDVSTTSSSSASPLWGVRRVFGYPGDGNQKRNHGRVQS